MKTWFAGVVLGLAASVASAAAMADGPRPSSAHNWGRMTNAAPAAAVAAQQAAATAPQPAAPRWVWREGYSHGGRWQGGWELLP